MTKNITFNHLRLGDCINYPQKGELVGVHYTLRSENGPL
jgi:hypothetical protein